MVNWIGLYTLTSREVGRFFSVYRQTVIPGLISSVLYILIFGFTLEQRISEIQGVSYTMFILPGLIMMNTLTNASSNTSSSMLQMKLLQQLPDLLTAVKRSGNCCKSFICSIDDEVLEDAFVKVFIIIRPGKINIVYDTPWISEMRCSKVNPNIKIYKTEDIRPGITVCR